MSDSTEREDGPACLECGTLVAETGTQRVRTAVEDGQIVYEHFCGPACLEAGTT